MSQNHIALKEVQQLVLDIINVERNHRIPKSERHENVVEHSFAVALLCWRMFELIRPPLNITKILKYALVHDFTERGLKTDINAYATPEERSAKKNREELELEKISTEFKNFDDFVLTVNNYETQSDEEALFVWSIDKMQAVILGGTIDQWRPYAEYEVSYEQFRQKMEDFTSRCSPYLKDIFVELVEESCCIYYDQPLKNEP